MSTSYGYRCRTHDELSIVKNLRHRWVPLLRALLEIKRADAGCYIDPPLRIFGGGLNADAFLEEHQPTCDVVIADEYGDEVKP